MLALLSNDKRTCLFVDLFAFLEVLRLEIAVSCIHEFDSGLWKKTSGGLFWHILHFLENIKILTVILIHYRVCCLRFEPPLLILN